MSIFVDADAILSQLRGIALTDVTDVVGISEGELSVRSSRELTPGQRAAIASVEKSAGGLKVKFYDKLKALELLGRYTGVFENPPADAAQNALLQAIDRSTGKEIDISDLPELQQAPAAGNDMVESAGTG